MHETSARELVRIVNSTSEPDEEIPISQRQVDAQPCALDFNVGIITLLKPLETLLTFDSLGFAGSSCSLVSLSAAFSFEISSADDPFQQYIPL
ncbi:unnamed protein product [Phytophthora lilii]|uniref:Unnamed protein product n=1 Tax=Phytophthora lilii TaxID=2077276 RepID=A0A9W6TN09_9STRA|nr:unnamed protein product [Phytophthora lilii]